MSSYKVIFRSDLTRSDEDCGLTWEPGCQLMFTAVQVSRNTETGEAYLQTKIENIGTQFVSSFGAEFECVYQDGLSEKHRAEMLDADLAPGGELTLKPIPLSKGNLVGATAFVTWLEAENTRWESKARPDGMPCRRRLTISQDALSERCRQLRERGCFRADEAKDYGYADNDTWTHCPCGKISMGRTQCPSCGLSFLEDPVAEDEETLIAAAKARVEEMRRKAAEVAAIERKEAERRAEVRGRVLRRIKRAAAIVVPFGVLAALFGFWLLPDVITPATKYSAAMNLYEKGEYEQAEAAFEDLGDYGDSAEMTRESRYAQAVSLAKGGSYAEAAVMMSELEGYSDSVEKHEEYTYLYAVTLAEEGKFEDAIELFSALGEYGDSSSQLKQTQYKHASNLAEEGDFSHAAEIYEDLGVYKDSADRAMDAKYNHAVSLMEKGSLAEAAIAMEGLDGYGDSAEMAKECHYLVAKDFIDSFEYTDAKYHLEKIAGYKDADAYKKMLGNITSDIYYNDEYRSLHFIWFVTRIDTSNCASKLMMYDGQYNGFSDDAYEIDFSTSVWTEWKESGGLIYLNRTGEEPASGEFYYTAEIGKESAIVQSHNGDGPNSRDTYYLLPSDKAESLKKNWVEYFYEDEYGYWQDEADWKPAEATI